MSIGSIVRIRQPDVYKRLVSIANKEKCNKNNKKIDNISFRDFEKMMQHDSYKRSRGAVRQVIHSE